ncbi:sporulation protein YpjB [Cohnella abietis]|uniref:Sporulation protein YpjB n=1 Tax=Cohnella abietis TaxID=2507935 RepID=A0A3T1D541_9BACL|nr:sporulation protein YpjB [Cohnella abietis]BBI33226.1 hypothetical protein KCTCHS21_26250 [Cohnella abietis]
MFLLTLQFQRRRRLRIMAASILLSLCLFICTPALALGSPSVASQSLVSNKVDQATGKAYDSFLKSAIALYDAVNDGEIEVVMQCLAAIEEQFRSLSMKEIVTADGIHALAQNVTEMKRAVAASSPDEHKWKSGAAALRLAADALAHPSKPIWHQYRNVLNEDIARLSKALPGKSSDSSAISKTALLAYNQLSEHYRVIRTAALLKEEPWKIERGDSVLRYTDRILKGNAPNEQMLQGAIKALQEAMDGLFPGSKQTSATIVPPITTAPPSWGWTAMMGSFIVTILTWVGWKRYKVDEYVGQGKRNKPDESEDAAQKMLKRWKK